jgi:uncharacterized protein YjbI with pentapeptide repeats
MSGRFRLTCHNSSGPSTRSRRSTCRKRGRHVRRVLLAGIGTCMLVTTVAIAGPSYARSSLPRGDPHPATEVIDGCTVVVHPTRRDFTECPGQDLSQADFTGVDLRFANFSGASFADTNCEGSVGKDTVCPGAELDDADLDHANVSNAVFFYSNFIAIQLASSEASLSGTSMRDMDASGARFGDLSDLDLQRSNLTGASFLDASGANLTSANLSDVTENVIAPDLSDAKLQGTIFNGSDIPDSTFNGAGLSTRTQFDEAVIQGDVFTGTRLVPADRTVATSSPTGKIVKWKTPKALPGATPGSCDPASGSLFPVGVTTVQCSVVGVAGLPGVGGSNTASGTFTVTVK